MTIKNNYPFPKIYNLFDHMRESNIFSKIGLRFEYQQFRIKKQDIHKTTFKTRYGHYEFMVVLFGITNALAIFMRLMSSVFKKYLDTLIII